MDKRRNSCVHVSLSNFSSNFNFYSSFSYRDAKDKIRNAIAENFGLGPNSIYLTSPTFFSEMTPNPAKTVHDEYWHPHVDKVSYYQMLNVQQLSNHLIARKLTKPSTSHPFCTSAITEGISKAAVLYSLITIKPIAPLNLVKVS